MQSEHHTIGSGSHHDSDSMIEIKGDLAENHHKVESLALNGWDMWALGITIVIGGQYFAWNEALQAGFGNILVATILVATAYVSLIMCISELSSALPFAGKADVLILILILV